MTSHDRKAARAAYDRRSIKSGLFSLSCQGQTWVGISADLDKTPNQIGFSLKLGSHPNRALQAACTNAPYTFEVLEVISPSEDHLAQGLQLRNRLNYWLQHLNAQRL